MHDHRSATEPAELRPASKRLAHRDRLRASTNHIPCYALSKGSRLACMRTSRGASLEYVAHRIRRLLQRVCAGAAVASGASSCLAALCAVPAAFTAMTIGTLAMSAPSSFISPAGSAQDSRPHGTWTEPCACHRGPKRRGPRNCECDGRPRASSTLHRKHGCRTGCFLATQKRLLFETCPKSLEIWIIA